MAVSPSEYVAAPLELDLVIDFVNTFDPDTGEDELASPDGLAAWLARRGLLEERARSARERDRLEAIDLREALRGLMLANNGVGTQAGASAVLERIARNGGLSARFLPSGEAVLEPEARGMDGALARLLVPVFESSRDGSWQRAKACRADDCQWAFYDRSRNRSGTWCEMAVCGNRAKVRNYRDRRAERAR